MNGIWYVYVKLSKIVQTKIVKYVIYKTYSWTTWTRRTVWKTVLIIISSKNVVLSSFRPKNAPKQTHFEEARKFMKEEIIAKELAGGKEKNSQLTRRDTEAEEGQLVWVVSPYKWQELILDYIFLIETSCLF